MDIGKDQQKCVQVLLLLFDRLATNNDTAFWLKHSGTYDSTSFTQEDFVNALMSLRGLYCDEPDQHTTSSTAEVLGGEFSIGLNLLNVLLSVFVFCAMLMALIFNGKILHEARRNPALRQGDRHIGFVVSMALANALFAVVKVVQFVIFIVIFVVVLVGILTEGVQTIEDHVECKITRAFTFVAQLLYGVSVYTLAALSVDRYLGLTKQITNRAFNNLNKNKQKEKWTRETILDFIKVASVWMMSLLLATPIAIPATENFNEIEDVADEPDANNATTEITTGQPKTSTRADWCSFFDKIGIAWYNFVVYGVIPVSIIAVFYCAAAYRMFHGQAIRGNEEQVKQRKKSARSLIQLSMVVFLCVLPSQLVGLLTVYGVFGELSQQTFSLLGGMMMYVNLFVSPAILCFIAEKYRVAILGILKKKKSQKASAAASADATKAVATESGTAINDQKKASEVIEMPPV